MNKLLLLLFSLLISSNSYGVSNCYWTLVEQIECGSSVGCPSIPSSLLEEIVEPLSTAETAQKLTNLALDDQIKKYDPTWDNVEPISSPKDVPIFTGKNDTKPFTGKNLCKYENDWEGNGQIEANYKDGKLDGKLTGWNENGQIEFKGNFKNGKLDGKQTTWWENGQISSELNWKDGKEDGKVTYWDENGQIVIELNYKEGELDGKVTYLEAQAIYKDNECISGDCDFNYIW